MSFSQLIQNLFLPWHTYVIFTFTKETATYYYQLVTYTNNKYNFTEE